MLDEMHMPLIDLLRNYMAKAGTDMNGAVRDVITELASVCDKEKLDIDRIIKSGLEVYEEENGTFGCNDGCAELGSN